MNATSQGSNTRPFYWSVRRELWENRSIYIALVIVAVIEIIGFGFSLVGQADRRRAVLLLDPISQRHGIEQPYDIAAIMMMVTAFIVGFFYCLDALYGERRDRSVLFWKSLPVSDSTAVLAKITVPLLVLPALAFVISVCTELVMLVMSSVTLLTHGVDASTTWTHVPFLQNWLILLYGLVAAALWHAPIYSWSLLVSVSVRRATFLWAFLPFLAGGIFERITFGSSYVQVFLKYRLFSFATKAFETHGQEHGAIDSFAQLTPGTFLLSLGLWLGLLAAAAFLLAAARLRRYRGPL